MSSYADGGGCYETYSPADGDIRLGALVQPADGSPPYFPLLDGSIALNVGDPAHCPNVDQLGNPRPNPSGNNCDLGAVEANSLPPTETHTPTTTHTHTPVLNPTESPTATSVPAGIIIVGENCSLANAIRSANDDRAHGGCIAGNGSDTILILENLSLDASLPRITSEISIKSSYNELATSSGGRLFSVASQGNLTLSKLRFTASAGSSFVDNAGSLQVDASSFRNGKAGSGGAIYNSGQMSIRSSFFSGNISTSRYGGAIRNENRATITNSTFASNYSNSGTAIAGNEGSYTKIVNSTIYGNVTRGGGNGQGKCHLHRAIWRKRIVIVQQHRGGKWRPLVLQAIGSRAIHISAQL